MMHSPGQIPNGYQMAASPRSSPGMLTVSKIIRQTSPALSHSPHSPGSIDPRTSSQKSCQNPCLRIILPDFTETDVSIQVCVSRFVYPGLCILVCVSRFMYPGLCIQVCVSWFMYPGLCIQVCVSWFVYPGLCMALSQCATYF